MYQVEECFYMRVRGVNMGLWITYEWSRLKHKVV